ncbi:unnamed protein product [Somion occarium]|uniref:Uncharacterized protein n=1 Tax=Somion occarium TaxID=3059160 RepID=A0ABP1DNK4_9APHY
MSIKWRSVRKKRCKRCLPPVESVWLCLPRASFLKLWCQKQTQRKFQSTEGYSGSSFEAQLLHFSRFQQRLKFHHIPEEEAIEVGFRSLQTAANFALLQECTSSVKGGVRCTASVMPDDDNTNSFGMNLPISSRVILMTMIYGSAGFVNKTQLHALLHCRTTFFRARLPTCASYTPYIFMFPYEHGSALHSPDNPTGIAYLLMDMLSGHLLRWCNTDAA